MRIVSSLPLLCILHYGERLTSEYQLFDDDQNAPFLLFGLMLCFLNVKAIVVEAKMATGVSLSMSLGVT
jgi:hypothetical protein